MAARPRVLTWYAATVCRDLIIARERAKSMAVSAHMDSETVPAAAPGRLLAGFIFQDFASHLNAK